MNQKLKTPNLNELLIVVCLSLLLLSLITNNQTEQLLLLSVFQSSMELKPGGVLGVKIQSSGPNLSALFFSVIVQNVGNFGF